jgi:hypothetical protein
MRLILKMPANPGVSRSASDSGLEDADESIRPLSAGRAVADRLADHLGRLRQGSGSTYRLARTRRNRRTAVHQLWGGGWAIAARLGSRIDAWQPPLSRGVFES